MQRLVPHQFRIFTHPPDRPNSCALTPMRLSPSAPENARPWTARSHALRGNGAPAAPRRVAKSPIPLSFVPFVSSCQMAPPVLPISVFICPHPSPSVFLALEMLRRSHSSLRPARSVARFFSPQCPPRDQNQPRFPAQKTSNPTQTPLSKYAQPRFLDYPEFSPTLDLMRRREELAAICRGISRLTVAQH
jgi:hypothetical protein